MFTHQATDAFLFVTHYKGKWPCQVSVIILGFGLTRQSNHPDLLFFQEINSAGEICFLRNKQVFSSPS